MVLCINKKLYRKKYKIVMLCFSQIKSLPSDEPDQTIEILMSELDPKVREMGTAALFYCSCRV